MKTSQEIAESLSETQKRALRWLPEIVHVPYMDSLEELGLVKETRGRGGFAPTDLGKEVMDKLEATNP